MATTDFEAVPAVAGEATARAGTIVMKFGGTSVGDPQKLKDVAARIVAAHGISQIVWSPLAQGVLTGKYLPGQPPPAGTRMGSEVMGWAMNRFRDDDVLEAVQRLRPIADGLGITMAQLALAWVLREPNVAAAIIGATKPEQVEDNAAASGVELDDATLGAIDEAVADVVVRAPVSV